MGSFSHRLDAHAAEGFLRSHGVPATIVADDNHGQYVEFAHRVWLLVPATHAQRARELLADQEVAPAAGSRWGELVVAVALLAATLAIIVFGYRLNHPGPEVPREVGEDVRPGAPTVTLDP